MTHFGFDPQRYPTNPGCYLMKDAAGQVIYVGKAKDLRHRLSSYFQAGPKHGRTRRLLARIAAIEAILVNNELEALVLENNLIKRYRPRYNRRLVNEDEGYTCIVLTGEALPRFVPYRKNWVNRELTQAGGAAGTKRFGPYVHRRFRDVLLEFVCDSFQLRTCRQLPQKVCLRYHLRRCSGICARQVSPAEYARAVEQAAAFLSRQHTDLLREMRRRMQAHAERLEFEQAQRMRDQLAALESTLERQIVEREVDHDQDVVCFGPRHALVAEIERGALQGLHLHELDPGGADAAACERFLLSHYARGCPEELIANRLEDPRRVAEALSAANGKRVSVTLPAQGVGRELLELCALNYAYRSACS